MSLTDDLARNRRVFGRLTGDFDEHAEEESAKKTSIEDFAPLEAPQGAGRELPEMYVPAESPPKARGFSLTRDLGGETEMLSSPAQPDDVSFPALRASEPAVTADPFDELYRRLEAEGRMASQLAGEEEEW